MEFRYRLPSFVFLFVAAPYISRRRELGGRSRRSPADRQSEPQGGKGYYARRKGRVIDADVQGGKLVHRRGASCQLNLLGLCLMSTMSSPLCPARVPLDSLSGTSRRGWPIQEQPSDCVEVEIQPVGKSDKRSARGEFATWPSCSTIRAKNGRCIARQLVGQAGPNYAPSPPIRAADPVSRGLRRAPLRVAALQDHKRPGMSVFLSVLVSECLESRCCECMVSTFWRARLLLHRYAWFVTASLPQRRSSPRHIHSAPAQQFPRGPRTRQLSCRCLPMPGACVGRPGGIVTAAQPLQTRRRSLFGCGIAYEGQIPSSGRADARQTRMTQVALASTSVGGVGFS